MFDKNHLGHELVLKTGGISHYYCECINCYIDILYREYGNNYWTWDYNDLGIPLELSCKEQIIKNIIE